MCDTRFSYAKDEDLKMEFRREIRKEAAKCEHSRQEACFYGFYGEGKSAAANFQPSEEEKKLRTRRQSL